MMNFLETDTIRFLLKEIEKQADAHFENKRNKVVREYNSIQICLKEKYQNYKKKHEELLQNIQRDIDSINKCKPVMKYLLEELGHILQIETSDYPLESLDYRKFDINKDYDIIAKEQCVMEKEIHEVEDFWYRPGNFCRYISETRKIQKKIKKIKSLWTFNEPKMNADLQRLSNLDETLRDISDIYCNMRNNVLPFYKDKLKILREEYDDIYDLPDNIHLFLYSTTEILKSMAEKKILCYNDVESIKKYRDDIAIENNKLKELIDKKD